MDLSSDLSLVMDLSGEEASIQFTVPDINNEDKYFLTGVAKNLG